MAEQDGKTGEDKDEAKPEGEPAAKKADEVSDEELEAVAGGLSITGVTDVTVHPLSPINKIGEFGGMIPTSTISSSIPKKT